MLNAQHNIGIKARGAWSFAAAINTGLVAFSAQISSPTARRVSSKEHTLLNLTYLRTCGTKGTPDSNPGWLANLLSPQVSLGLVGRSYGRSTGSIGSGRRDTGTDVL
jgi:hypothetical protein